MPLPLASGVPRGRGPRRVRLQLVGGRHLHRAVLGHRRGHRRLDPRQDGSTLRLRLLHHLRPRHFRRRRRFHHQRHRRLPGHHRGGTHQGCGEPAHADPRVERSHATRGGADLFPTKAVSAHQRTQVPTSPMALPVDQAVQVAHGNSHHVVRGGQHGDHVEPADESRDARATGADPGGEGDQPEAH